MLFTCIYAYTQVAPYLDDQLKHLLLMHTGVDHLLPKGDGTAPETQIACFMGLLSHLASKPEVLRIAPRYSTRLANAVASAIVQSATTTSTSMQDAGLDGNGEVIQVMTCWEASNGVGYLVVDMYAI